jgi:hypothetical protein
MGVKLGNGKWAIKEDKLLAYNDNSGRFFNKEFDFSRGSSATYVAKDGLIKTAGLQATNLVNNGDFSELGSELVTNGNFDTDSDWTKGTGWTISGGAAVAVAGTSSKLEQQISGLNGKTCKVSLTLSNYGGSGSMYVDFGNVNSSLINTNGEHILYGTFSQNELELFKGGAFSGSIDNVSVKQVDPNDYWTLGTGWSIGDGVAICDGTDGVNLSQNGVIENGKTYKIKLDVNLTSGILLLRVGLSYSTDLTINESGSYQIIVVSDGTNFILRSGVFNGSVTNISIQEIQTDTPRIDFSHSVKGALLLEPQSTQLLQYSEDFSQWIKTSEVAITSNYGISPDGTKSSSRVLFYYASEILKLNFTATNDVIASIYIKGTEGETIRFGLQDGETNFTLTGDWQRINRYRSGGHTGGSENININTYGGVTARDIEVWGAMVEQKSFATSYIPNHGVSGGVTRLADVCNNSGSAQDFNSEEGVLYCEIAALADDETNRKIAIGSSTNRIIFGYRYGSNKVRVEIISSDSVVFDNTQIIDNITTFNKFAVKYKQNDFSLWINSQKVSVDTSGNTPIGLNELAFDDGSTNPFYGKVRELQVFTEALTDEQLEKLTQV